MVPATLDRLTVALSLVLAIGIGEALLSLVLSDPASRIPSTPQEELSRLIDYHAEIGWVGLSNARGPFMGEEVIHNSHGFRSAEIRLVRSEKPRILFLGDSQTWGYGLAQNQTLPSQVKEVFGNQSVDVEVLNLGIPGYGIDQSFLRYVLQGHRFQADAVVFLAMNNDLREAKTHRMWGLEKPQFYIGHEGKLCLGNVPVPRAHGWVSNQVWRPHWNRPEIGGWQPNLRALHLVQLLESLEWHPGLLEIIPRSSHLGLALRIPCQTRKVDSRNRAEVLPHLLEKLLNHTGSVGTKLVIASAPTRRDRLRGKMGRWEASIREFAEIRDVPYLSLLPHLEDESYRDPLHFSAEGSYRAAAAIVQKLAPFFPHAKTAKRASP